MKTIYLAGKVNSSEKEISKFALELESRGHVVLEKWWLKDTLPMPYLDHPQTSAAAKVMIQAAYESEVTILFANEQMLGAAVEFGAAIASSLSKPKQIIVLLPANARQSVFYTHPAVEVVDDLEKIREMDWF